MTVAQLVPLFLAWCGQHRSPATARFYRLGLRVVVARLGDRAVAELRQHEVESALAEAGRRADGTPLAPDTLRRNAIAVQSLQKWCLKNRYLSEPVVESLEKPAGRKRERIPDPDEIRRLLDGAPPAFAAIYTALRLCGARPNELVRATLADYDREAGTITLAAHKTARKTGKPRVIPVGSQLAALIVRATAGRAEGSLFLRDDGRAWTVGHLSALFRRRRDKLGLPKDLCLYLTRHEHGTRLLEQVRDLKAVADALGHADIKTTQRYVHKTTAELRRNQDALRLPGVDPDPAPPASDTARDAAPDGAPPVED